MSNIYIQEPPTNGKVLLQTSAGDIDIELWSREAPKACRNFVQLCMEGYYDNTIFHRLVKGFIVQGGDPTGTGEGGSSIWGKPFKDEIHSRLRFSRRGLVAMANSGKDDNGSQFFFTLGPTPELQSKHTLFGKVAGDTIYNMIKLEEGEVDEDEKPLYPYKILSTKILNNPFDDIVPREIIKKDKSKKLKKSAVATKNYSLLSFGEEAEEEEDEVDQLNKQYSGKGKSSHDLLTNDPKLSSEPAIELDSTEPKSADEDENESGSEEEGPATKSKSDQLTADAIRDKLKKQEKKSSLPKSRSTTSLDKANASDSDSDGEYYLGKSEAKAKAKHLKKLKDEVKDFKREMKKAEKEKNAEKASGPSDADLDEKGRKDKLASENNMIKNFLEDQQKYKDKNKDTKKKGTAREAETMALLARFQKKIETAKETYGELEPIAQPATSKTMGGDSDPEDSIDDISWLARKLQNQEQDVVMAKDANLKSDDWFEIHDPRNPINKRRREGKGDKDKSSSSKKSKF